MLSIVTACSRPQNLKQIYDSIDFSKIDYWYIVYDTSRCRSYDLQFATEPKILELMCDMTGLAGHPQINYAFSFIKEGFVYIMDDDNIFHPTFWDLLPTLDKNTIYTWDQERIQENRILKGGVIKNTYIDTSQFIVPRHLIGSIRWPNNKLGGDFVFISQIYKRHKNKFVYIPKIACYHNFIKKVKVALCFFGLTRSLKMTMASIKQYIFEPLKSGGIKYDIYLHTYSLKDNYTNTRAGETNIILDKNEYKLLNPDHSLIEDKDIISKKLKLEEYRRNGNPWGHEKKDSVDNYTTLDNFILSLWSIKQLTEMVLKNNDKYTHMIFCRPDVIYMIPLDIKWFHFNSDTVYMPNISLYPIVNDRFLLGPIDQVIKVGQRFDDALAYSKRHRIHSETFLHSYLKKNKIKFDYIYFYFIRLRANKMKNDTDMTLIKKLTRRKRPLKKGTRKRHDNYIEISPL
jgi:hypothetical protein